MTVRRSSKSYSWLALLVVLIVAVSAPSWGLAAAGEPAGISDAARSGNWDAVRSLIAKGLRDDGVNSADKDGTRPLHWAVRADELEVTDLLLRAGADATAPNRLGLTPIYLAAANGNGAIIRKLLEHGANANQVEKTGETILMVATRSGNADAVKAILDAGA